MNEITVNTKIVEALNINPACEKALADVGMLCIGCAMARGETVAEAAIAHNVDANLLVKKMNEAK